MDCFEATRRGDLKATGVSLNGRGGICVMNLAIGCFSRISGKTKWMKLKADMWIRPT